LTSLEERKMLKSVVAATAVLAIAGSSVVYAQQGFGDQHGFRHWGHHRPSAADLAAFTDARIAALKAGLELTPDQQKNWPAFEQALRELAQLRIQGIEARQQQADSGQPGQASPFDRLAKRADNMAKRSAALKKISDAGAPLYQSLTDAQKERFKVLARILRPHHRRMASNDRDGGWQGRGMGRGPGAGGGHHRLGGEGSGDGGGNDGGSGSQL
jgi:zinc resistance-associated protein